MDDATGDVVGLQLGADAPLCSTAGAPRSFVVADDGYIASLRVAVDVATGLVGELSFVVKSNSSLVPTNYVTCGTQGGVGVLVTPPLSWVSSVTAGCKKTTTSDGQASLAIDAPTLKIAVAPAKLRLPKPTPWPTVLPLTVTPSVANLARNAPALVINGTGFDPAAAGDSVTLNLGAAGTVTSATSTQLTVTFSTAPTSSGNLTAVVTSFGGSSGAPVQVATVVDPPAVTPSVANLARNAPALVINGTGFDPAAAGDSVTLNLGAAGTVTSATSTQLTVTFSTAPTSSGNLTAVVTSFGGSSGAPVQVATVVDPPAVTPSVANLARNAPALVINGTGFDPAAAGDSVTLNLGAAGTVTSATSTQLTVTFSTAPTSSGNLTAVVTSFGGSSGAPVQVATVVDPPAVTPSVANLARNAPALVINGTGFDPAAAGDSVTLNLGAAGTVTSATSTQLTVTFSTAPTSSGNLTAVVTSFGGSSGAPVQVATVVDPPAVTPSVANLARNAPALVINGTGFDPAAAGDSVTLNLGAAGTVTSATSTQLTVTFSTAPTSSGNLTAVVTSFGGSSGAPVQVATVVDPPAVTPSVANLARNAPALVINGTGFDPAAAGDSVTLNLGAAGTVTSATSTQLTVTFSTAPTSSGNLTAVVTSFGGSSGAPVQVATVVDPPAVTPSVANLARNAPALVINGTGFDPAAAGDSVTLNLGAAGTVTSATSTQLTVTFSTAPTSSGNLTAVVTSFGGSSGAPVQVATVVDPPAVTPSVANLARNAPALVINGTGFDPAAAGDSVTLNLGAAGTVTSATSTQLTVTFSTAPTSSGNLTAVVTSFGGSSGAPVQVATVVDPPAVTPSVANLARNAPALVINGTGFDPAAAGDSVTLNLGAAGTVTSATSTQLTVTFSTAPTSSGNLTAVVTSFGGSSGAPVQVATVVDPPAVTPSVANLARNAPALVINGTGFDPAAAGDSVTLNLGAAGTVTSATSTQLTVTFSTAPTSSGNLTAVVTSFGGSSGAPVQVATVVDPPAVTPSVANLARNAPALVINGTGFDPAAAGDSVTLNLGAAGTVTSATSTQLTVTFSTAPTSSGNLTAVVTSFGGSSGAPVQVATVVDPPLVQCTKVVTTQLNSKSPFSESVQLKVDAVGGGGGAGSSTGGGGYGGGGGSSGVKINGNTVTASSGGAGGRSVFNLPFLGYSSSPVSATVTLNPGDDLYVVVGGGGGAGGAPYGQTPKPAYRNDQSGGGGGAGLFGGGGGGGAEGKGQTLPSPVGGRGGTGNSGGAAGTMSPYYSKFFSPATGGYYLGGGRGAYDFYGDSSFAGQGGYAGTGGNPGAYGFAGGGGGGFGSGKFQSG